MFPDVIQGIAADRAVTGNVNDSPRTPDYELHADMHTDPGLPRRRDPEALPPQNLFESAMRFLYRFVVGLGSGNAVFSLKAGLLTVLLCLPSFIKSSATFAYGASPMPFSEVLRLLRAGLTQKTDLFGLCQ